MTQRTEAEQIMAERALDFLTGQLFGDVMSRQLADEERIYDDDYNLITVAVPREDGLIWHKAPPRSPEHAIDYEELETERTRLAERRSTGYSSTLAEDSFFWTKAWVELDWLRAVETPDNDAKIELIVRFSMLAFTQGLRPRELAFNANLHRQLLRHSRRHKRLCFAALANMVEQNPRCATAILIRTIDERSQPCHVTEFEDEEPLETTIIGFYRNCLANLDAPTDTALRTIRLTIPDPELYYMAPLTTTPHCRRTPAECSAYCGQEPQLIDVNMHIPSADVWGSEPLARFAGSMDCERILLHTDTDVTHDDAHRSALAREVIFQILRHHMFARILRPAFPSALPRGPLEVARPTATRRNKFRHLSNYLAQFVEMGGRPDYATVDCVIIQGLQDALTDDTSGSFQGMKVRFLDSISTLAALLIDEHAMGIRGMPAFLKRFVLELVIELLARCEGLEGWAHRGRRDALPEQPTYREASGEIGQLGNYDDRHLPTGNRSRHMPREVYTDRQEDAPGETIVAQIRRDCLVVIANMVYENEAMQDQLRIQDGLPLILAQGRIDDNLPSLQQHAIFCLRCAIDGNDLSQQAIASLQPQAVLDNPALAQAGYEAYLDPAGKAHLRPRT